ncbi:hypothetical protein AU195_09165 [Mycobacterium sp. IS-1496]|nr:hypothetical protein AU195_09165 [Mycobacterium sp. IS-1496]
MAAVVNTLVVEFAVWIFLPWFVLAIYVLPLLLVDLVIALILRSRVGASGQIGQGMLIGLIAAPAALALFLPGLMLAQASGLI